MQAFELSFCLTWEQMREMRGLQPTLLAKWAMGCVQTELDRHMGKCIIRDTVDNHQDECR